MADIIEFPSPPEYKKFTELKLILDTRREALFHYMLEVLSKVHPGFQSEAELDAYADMIKEINGYAKLQSDYSLLLENT